MKSENTYVIKNLQSSGHSTRYWIAASAPSLRTSSVMTRSTAVGLWSQSWTAIIGIAKTDDMRGANKNTRERERTSAGDERTKTSVRHKRAKTCVGEGGRGCVRAMSE